MLTRQQWNRHCGLPIDVNGQRFIMGQTIDLEGYDEINKERYWAIQLENPMSYMQSTVDPKVAKPVVKSICPFNDLAVLKEFENRFNNGWAVYLYKEEGYVARDTQGMGRRPLYYKEGQFLVERGYNVFQYQEGEYIEEN